MTEISLALYILSVSYSMCSPDSGSHSLLYFSTFIKGETPFPEFSAVLMLDDIPLAYYSSNEQKHFPRGPTKEEDMFHVADHKFTTFALTTMHNAIRAQTHRLIHHYNNTHGIPFLQSIFGCDLLNHNAPGRMIYKESFSGNIGNEVLRSISDKTFQTVLRAPGDWNAEEKYWRLVIADFFEPFCLTTLHKALQINRKHVMRKVKPRVRLFQKALPDSGGMKVTCLATGFYPRHINLTLFRDGQPLDSHQITGGELLPNGDGTYQMRKSLEVSTDDLKENYQYTCTAEHLSLDNKLDIPLDYEPYPGQKHVVAVLLIALVCLTVVIIIFVFVFCRKRCMANNRCLRIHQGREKCLDEGEQGPSSEHTLLRSSSSQSVEVQRRIEHQRPQKISTPVTAEGGPDTPAQNGDEKRENEEEEEKGEEERSPP